MGKVWIGVRKHLEHLQRLSVVYAIPLRLKIVTELYQREMSPKQFFEEFGGGDASRVAKHFERLRETGWLRLVRTAGPGGRRRGGVEMIHRATELAFCDRETWAVLPYSIRVTVTWNASKEIARHLREAIEAHVFQARADRHLSGTRVLLDQQGHERVADAVAVEFGGQYEEQEDARRRTDHTGEELFGVGSLLLGFELPPDDGDLPDGPELVPSKAPLTPVPVRLSKAFADGLCMQIVDEANLAPISTSIFFAKYGEQLKGTVRHRKDMIRRRLKKMEKAGWLAEVGQQTGGHRRGGREKLYRATGPALYDEEENAPWTDAPEELTDTADWATFLQVSEWAKTAMVAGTLNRRDDTTIAWSILRLDRQGWERVGASLKKLLALAREEEKLARARMRASGETPTPMVVALGLFETAPAAKEL